MKKDNKIQTSTSNDNKLEEITNNWKRALADYQNLVKRTEIDKQNWYKFSTKKIILKFLPIMDTLEEANKHLKDKSIELALKQFRDILKEEDIREIEALGRDFNPLLHEPIDVIEGTNDNKIDKIYSKGYFYKDEILRPAKVRVIRKQIK